jgi:hypothetical protein
MDYDKYYKNKLKTNSQSQIIRGKHTVGLRKIDIYEGFFKNINVNKLNVKSFNFNKISLIIKKLEILKNIYNTEIKNNEKLINKKKYIEDTLKSLSKNLNKKLSISKKIIENREKKEKNNNEKLQKINELLTFLDKIEEEFKKCTNESVKKISENHNNYNLILNKIIKLPNSNLIKNLKNYAISLNKDKSNKIKYIKDVISYMKDSIIKIKSDLKKIIDPSNEKFIELYKNLIITEMNIDEKIRYLEDLIANYKSLYNNQQYNNSNKSKEFKIYYKESQFYLKHLEFLREFYTITKNVRLVKYFPRDSLYINLIKNIKKQLPLDILTKFNILGIIKNNLKSHTTEYIESLGLSK